MAFRFFRRIKIAPGVSINLSKSGGSLSFGPRGAKVTVGPRGIRKTAGIPGTGMYWTDHSGYGASGSNSNRGKRPPVPEPRPADRLSLGFFRRLVTPQSEEDFVDGMRCFVAGDEAAARRHFRKAPELADAAFMAGILSLKRERYADAEQALQNARRNQSRLGRQFQKYGVEATIALPITDHVSAIVGPDVRGLLLALAEVHQYAGRPQAATDELRRLNRRNPDDVVVRLALAELLIEQGSRKQNWQAAVRLAEAVDNESEIHAGLLLYKAKALRKLGLPIAARDTLTATLRRKKNRSAELLLALRYERMLVYETLGHNGRMRNELERLYAEDVDHEDVAARLHLE